VVAEHQEEKRLFLTYRRTGDLRVRDALIERYLPLARSLARRYRGASEPLEDLEQVASLALVRAVEGFDPARGTAFSSYAVPSIAGAIKRHFRDYGWSLPMPRELQDSRSASSG
jgi:RNA polymerase sigma-B factor